MTVDFSSKHEESTTYFATCQTSAIDDNNQEELLSVENDLKKNQHGFFEETNTRIKNTDQPFCEKDELTFGSKVTTRSSSRPGKRPTTSSPQEILNLTPGSSKDDSKRLKLSDKPKKRQWKSWGVKEKNVFFEALTEHSKDFDKIHSCLMKRRDLSSVVKNKDQVRHFYYRTFNKISKYVPEAHDPLESRKTDYEVRCLICYNELRKKLRSLKEKDGKKLTELIATGKTTVRHHGRNFNIRAPVCRALKKSNSAVDEADQAPTKIIMELVPKDNQTWCVIQRLAQNPRLRTSISSRKTLYDLLMYLHYKWKLHGHMTITLSPSLVKSHRKAVLNKTNENECLAKGKQAGEEKIGDDVEKEQSSPENTCKNEKGPTKVVKNSKDQVNECFDSPNNSSDQIKQTIKTKKNDNVQKENTVHSRLEEDEKIQNEFQSPKNEILETKCDVIPENDDIILIRKKGDEQCEKKDAVCEKEEMQLDENLDETSNSVRDDICEAKWDIHNCSSITISDVYRKLGSPHKLLLCYSLSLEESGNELLTCQAVEHLVKIATGEFRGRNEIKHLNKRDSTNQSPSSSKARLIPKECINITKPNKVSKTPATVNTISPSTTPPSKPLRAPIKTAPRPKLAPKLVPEPSLVIPTIVPSVLNQFSARNTSRSGNHLTFGFAPISSVQSPPYLPKSKKNVKSRVVVQRTLLPRPVTEAGNSLVNKETNQPSLISSQPNSESSKEIENIVVKDDAGKHASKQLRLDISSTQDSSSGFCVDSLLNLALVQDLPENVEKLLSGSSKSTQPYGGVVCTEELDRGVSGGGSSITRSTKEAKSLDEEIENLHHRKIEHCVDQSQELLDNLKSSEDEDPFKLLSPSHIQQFHPEWLNEESSDFSLSNIFGHMDHSPSKQKPVNILDTPKKGQADFKLHGDDENENSSRFSTSEPVFCDMVDESSVDYVKKFRDLAKEMKSDSETTVLHSSGLPSNSNQLVSFKSFLSQAAKNH